MSERGERRRDADPVRSAWTGVESNHAPYRRLSDSTQPLRHGPVADSLPCGRRAEGDHAAYVVALVCLQEKTGALWAWWTVTYPDGRSGVVLADVSRDEAIRIITAQLTAPDAHE